MESYLAKNPHEEQLVNQINLNIKSLKNSPQIFAKENFKFQRLEKQFKEKKLWVEGVPKLKTIEQIFKERGSYKILDTIKGKDMLGWRYSGPFDELDAQNVD